MYEMVSNISIHVTEVIENVTTEDQHNLCVMVPHYGLHIEAHMDRSPSIHVTEVIENVTTEDQHNLHVCVVVPHYGLHIEAHMDRSPSTDTAVQQSSGYVNDSCCSLSCPADDASMGRNMTLLVTNELQSEVSYMYLNMYMYM